MAEKKAWFGSLVLVVNEHTSPAFFSWAAYHICEIQALFQALQREHRLWPGIALTLQHLETSTGLLSRVARSL